MSTIADQNVKTRFLIISDTHGEDFNAEDKPLPRADVAIHCGDLSSHSMMEEFRTTVRLLKEIDAPLKLVIAGNHDYTMDLPYFEDKVGHLEARDGVEEIYGAPGEAKLEFEGARAAGVVYLEEGTHQFTLENGALLTVYASQWTQTWGDWGFQFSPEEGHVFSIDKGVDVAMTHGPPKGVMDHTHRGQRSGCPSLFAAIARAKPRIHCFGHIHEDWGAKLITWRPELSENPSHLTDIDHDKSVVVDSLKDLVQSRFDTPEIAKAKRKKMQTYDRQKCCSTSHCAGDTTPLEHGSQTLFVNASIMGTNSLPTQKPWLVDMELPRSVASD